MDRSDINSQTERRGKKLIFPAIGLGNVTLDRLRRDFCRGRFQPRWCSSLQWFLSRKQRKTVSVCMQVLLLSWCFFFFQPTFNFGQQKSIAGSVFTVKDISKVQIRDRKSTITQGIRKRVSKELQQLEVAFNHPLMLKSRRFCSESVGA